MCYCKLLENRVGIMTLLYVHDPPVLPELNYISIHSNLLITSSTESRERSFLDKIIYLFRLRNHRQDGDVAVRGTGNLVR